MITPEMERQFGQAWLEMARKEGHGPNHATKKLGVRAQTKNAILAAVKKHGAAWAGLIAQEIGETPSKCSADLLRLVDNQMLVRRRPERGEVPPATQWIYELPEGAA